MAQLANALAIGVFALVILSLTWYRERLVSGSAPDPGALPAAYRRLFVVSGLITISIGLVLIVSHVVHF